MSELVCLDQLVQVHAQKPHCNAQMVAEIEVLRHLDNTVLVVRILFGVRDFS